MQKPDLSSMADADLKILKPRERVGLVVVLTGYGKGKTTSAMGIALRAAGHNMKVCIIGFLKGDMYSGEIDGIKGLSSNVELYLTGKGFCGIMGDPYPYEEHRAKAQDALKLAKEKMSSGRYDMLILDEIHNAVQLNLVDLQQVLALIDEKPPFMHMVLTGRDAPPEIVNRAHTVTEMKEIKHAFRQGIEPQQGVDY
jgi:cob(I)alamin adenosyltransferase